MSAARTPPAGRRDPTGRSTVAAAHELWLAAPQQPVPGVVRDLVAESWKRSLRLGVDPLAGEAPLDLDDGELRAYRAAHPLAPLMPLVRDLLTADAEEAGHIVAVGDAQGRLLWVEGHHGLRSRAEGMHFVEGALWSERGAGTNAPGTALALTAPVQIAAAEHFGVGVQPWSCVASPVRGPDGTVIGVIDLTGGDDVAGPRSLALVRACAAAMEAQLRLTPAPGSRPRPSGRVAAAVRPAGPAVRLPAPAHLRLRLLGTDTATLEHAGAPPLVLSRRHSEIVWLLSRARLGLGMQALDAALHPAGTHLVTVRAEMARLRRLLAAAGAGDLLRSRPYRLDRLPGSDVEDVRRLLARGAVHKALDLFTGPPLPGSDAPAVVQAREELVVEVRAAVLAARSVPALERWTALPVGHDDAEAWQALEAALPPGSPKRTTARAHRRRVATLVQPARA